jgi:hypothetical protein
MHPGQWAADAPQQERTVGVHQQDLIALSGKPVSKPHRRSGFAYAAFASNRYFHAGLPSWWVVEVFLKP